MPSLLMAPHVLIAMMTRRMLGYNTHSGVFCAHRHVNGMTAALSISITARENMGESIRLYSVKCELTEPRERLGSTRAGSTGPTATLWWHRCAAPSP